jgi:hypothetical protein
MGYFTSQLFSDVNRIPVAPGHVTSWDVPPLFGMNREARPVPLITFQSTVSVLNLCVGVGLRGSRLILDLTKLFSVSYNTERVARNLET